MGHHKVIIIGSGPAGYAAGIYTARAELEPLVFAGEKSGGQLMLTTEVENFPGLAEGKMGPELMMGMREQAEKFGAKMVDHDVLRVDFSKRPYKVWAGKHVHEEHKDHVHPEHMGEGDEGSKEEHPHSEHVDTADAVIISTGAESITLGVEGESKYIGRGVSYCAVCDAAFFRDKRVFVVGGGDAAMEDTLALVKFAKEITVVHRRDELRASRIMQRRVLEDHKDKVKMRWNSEVVEVKGDEQKITHIKVKDTKTGEEEELEADGLFVAIGHKPMTGIFKDQIELDEKGYIKTGIVYPSISNSQFPISNEDNVWISGFPAMTSKEGVFAAGDCVDFRYQQAVTAAGMGVMAALDAERWLERIIAE